MKDFIEKLNYEKKMFYQAISKHENQDFANSISETYYQIDKYCDDLIEILNLLDEMADNHPNKTKIRKIVLDVRNRIPRKFRKLFINHQKKE